VGLKIERAKQHFTDLVGKVDAWLKTNPYAFFRESDPESGDQLLRFQIQRDMPSDVWSPIIGDCIHNLRSALDHLVCALVLANRKKIYGGHQFPIYETADLYKLKSPGCVQGARKDAVKDIDSLKPYKGGNDGLWRLHLLDINDKHRGLIAVVGSNEGVTTDFSKLIASRNLPNPRPSRPGRSLLLQDSLPASEALPAQGRQTCSIGSPETTSEKVTITRRSPLLQRSMNRGFPNVNRSFQP